MSGVINWSTTPANNVVANTGITWDEGQLPSSVNDSARTTMAHLRTYFNALPFNRADYTTTQLALTAASGATLLIAPGTYTESVALTVPANTTIFGYGATLDFSGAATLVALTLASNVKIYGLKIIGNGNGSTYTVGGIGIQCSGTVGSYHTGPTLIDLDISYFTEYGIYKSFNNGGLIENCRITYVGYAGIGGISCNRQRIINNYIYSVLPGAPVAAGGFLVGGSYKIYTVGTTDFTLIGAASNTVGVTFTATGVGSGTGTATGPNSNAYGMFVDRGNGVLAVDPISYYCEMRGNIIEHVPTWEAIDTHAGQNFVIDANQVIDCKIGIVVTDSNVVSTPTYGPKNVAITNNVLTLSHLGIATDASFNTGSGIIVNGAYDTSVSTTVDFAECIAIANNTIQYGGVVGGTTDGAIRVRSSRGVNITGNSIRQPYVVGIQLYYDNNSFNVSGNTVVDPNDAVEDSYCIRVSSNNNTGYIGGNTLVLESTSTNTKVSEKAIAEGGGTGINIKLGDNVYVNKQTGRLVLDDFSRDYTATDTTPSVSNTDFLAITNAGAVTITNLDDGVEGQVVTLFFIDGNTTIDRSNAYLSGGANFTGTASDTLTLRNYGGKWYEIGRGVNA